MSKKIEYIISQVPIIGKMVLYLKKIPFFYVKEISVYDLMELYIKGIVDGAISNRAASVAFSFFMSLFPLALFLLNLIPYIPIDDFQKEFLSFIELNVPPTTYEAIEVILFDILNNSYSGLLSTGVFLSIFLMANGINALLISFEYSYHIEKSRNYFKQYGISVILSIALALFLIMFLAFNIAMEVIISKSDSQLAAQIFRIIGIFILIFITYSMIYKVGTKETSGVSFFSVGSFTATLLFGLSSYGFGFYVTNFSKYNELYGSIGTLLVIMIYIWLNCIILLLGFDLNATILKLKNKSIPLDKNL